MEGFGMCKERNYVKNENVFYRILKYIYGKLQISPNINMTQNRNKYMQEVEIMSSGRHLKKIAYLDEEVLLTNKTHPEVMLILEYIQRKRW